MEGPQLRITVAQRGVGAWISGWEGGGAGPISGAVNAHVTRAGHLGVSQWRVSDVLSGAGPAPTVNRQRPTPPLESRVTAA